MSERASFDFGGVLGYLVVRVAAVLEHGFTELMAAEGLTVRQFGMLAQVAGEDGLTSAELARRLDVLDVTAQSMGAQVDTLCRRGLLRRDPDPGRGRSVGLHITPAGEAVFGRAAALAHAYEQRTTGHLPAADRERLRALLLSIIGAAGEA